MSKIVLTPGDDIDKNFTILPNEAIRDRRLSWKARGMLAYLASHTNFSMNRATITNASDLDGDTAVRGALQELEDHGYLRREKRRADEKGVFAKSEWVVDRRGRLNSGAAQEELPLQPEPGTKNLELFPGQSAPADDPGKPATTAAEFLEIVIDEWYAMILLARPVDVFKVEHKRPKATPGRLRKLRTRIKEPLFMEQWRDAIARIGKIDGMHGKVEGKDGRTFLVTIDHFFAPDWVTKVMEGKYDTWMRKTPSAPAEATKKAYTGGL